MLENFVPDSRLFALKPWRGLLALMVDWGLIAASFTGVITWPHPLTYMLAAVIVARTQLALAIMMHESAHGVLLRGQWLNDTVGQAVAAGPLFLSLATYRAGHLKHHVAPMEHDDPVAVVCCINDYPVPRRTLFVRLLAALSGISYFAGAFRMARGKYRGLLPPAAKSPGMLAWEILSMLAANGLLFAVLAYFGHPLLYPGLWLLPVITLFPFMGRMRAIMEHAALPACSDQSQNARTIVRPSWQTFLFGPHAIHYHIEHHLYVRLPFYHLAAVHRQLADQQLLPSRNLYSGYGAILRDVTHPSLKEPAP